MRLEQKHAGRADRPLFGIVSVGLGDDARFLGHPRRQRMIEIVRVLKRVGEHELRPVLAVQIDQPKHGAVVDAHRVIAEIEKDRLAPRVAAASAASARRASFTCSRVMPLCRQSLADSPRSPNDRQTTSTL
jgi:hypothetical protein